MWPDQGVLAYGLTGMSGISQGRVRTRRIRQTDIGTEPLPNPRETMREIVFARVKTQPLPEVPTP